MWKRWSLSWKEEPKSAPPVKGDPAALQPGVESHTSAPKPNGTTVSTNETVSTTQPDTTNAETTTEATTYMKREHNIHPVVVMPDSKPADSSALIPAPALVPAPVSAPAPLPVPAPVPVASSPIPILKFNEAPEKNAKLTAPKSQQTGTIRHRISFRSLAYFYGRDKETFPSDPSPTPVGTEQAKVPKQNVSRVEKDSLSVAIAVRTLILGPSPLPPPASRSVISSKVFTKTTSVPDIKKVKGRLLKPKYANSIIAHLRKLPLPDGPSFHPGGAGTAPLVTYPAKGGGPIHAVCLPVTDEEAATLHFSRLKKNTHALPTNTKSAVSSPKTPGSPPPTSAPTEHQADMTTADLESLISVLKDLHPISLLGDSPDLGFGQAVSDTNMGPLAGSVPSPEVVLQGFEEITKQLMILGYTANIYPSHKGIYPPEDRLSVLTYWWGLELVLPEPSIKFLGKVKSISGTLINLLSALSLFDSGIREVLPFVRYISNFVDFEWTQIKSQDKGEGVICAATWIMPAAMIPRPWDFEPRPPAAPEASQNPSKDVTDKSTSKGVTDKNTSEDKSPPSKEAKPSVPPGLAITPQLMVTPPTLPRNAAPVRSP